MRLLFVTEGIPVPPCGGHLLRTHHQMKLLALEHEVDLIALAEPSRSNAANFKLDFFKAALAEFCTEVELIQAPSSTPRAKFINYASPFPSNATKLLRSGLPQTIAQRIKRIKYDAVIFLLSDTGLCLSPKYEGVAILDMVDLFSISFKYYSEIATSRLAKLRRQFDALRYARYERFVSRRFNKVLLVAQKDIQQYPDVVSQFHTDVDWVPHGISYHDFARPSHQSVNKNQILISGALNHPANVQGVEYFCEAVFPHVIQAMPSVKLNIVGSKPTPNILSLASDKIMVASDVPDIKPYLFTSAVSFCGVKLRMGTQTKILEAMAAGLPVVSTEEGNNGIGGTNGQHLFYSKDPRELAQSIVQLCTNESLWHTTSDTARQFVSTKFDWKNSTSKLLATIHETIERHRSLQS